MSLEALAAKRIRRQWEPEQKAWHDDALDVPWEDLHPALHKATLFALKNVFFFSHATPVQASTLSKLPAQGNSAIVEAPTGSGKTLAFLIPLVERTVRACEAFVAAHGRPPLNRHILGVILSPSRTLAEQTFVVARNLAARFPFNIQFALCDGVVETAPVVARRLRQGTRGAGTFLVTTPKDLADLLQALEEGKDDAESGGAVPEEEDMEELLAQQDERTRERYLAKRRRQEELAAAEASGGAGRGRRSAGSNGTAGRSSSTARDVRGDQTVRLFSSEANRFVLVIDEADLVFNSPEMRETVIAFVDKYCRRFSVNEESDKGQETPKKKGKKAKKASGKRARGDAEEPVAAAHDEEGESEKLFSDFAFVGATVATSDLLHDYARELCSACRTELHVVATSSTDDFVSQLQNRYVVCDAYNFVPFLVQMMNVHASKKHFVFFNNFRALLFVQRLFARLSEGVRPLLFVKNVYTMYEGMTENARIEQYNKFLTHTSSSSQAAIAEAASRAKRSAPTLTDAQKRNQVYQSGWKRDGRAPLGTGAILLCTDIAAFGLDVRDVDYVYHFEPPATVQSYVHRVGRVGRMGMKGSSILLLPCIDEGQQTLEKVRERKTTSTRFHTVTNTKNATLDIQSGRLSVDDLSDERQQYVKDLAAHSALEEASLPPFAPITATLRNVISQDDKLLKLAKAAAISICRPIDDEQVTWFSPKLALRALLLD